MITGFEKITAELTEYEMGLVPMIVNRLNSKIGEWNAVTSTHVVQVFKDNGFKMSAPRWRKIINHIRVNSLVTLLISTSKGYYRATTDEEVRNYLESLKQRINSITSVYDALEYQYKNTTIIDPTNR